MSELNWALQMLEDDLSGNLKHLDDRTWGRILAHLDMRDLLRLARLVLAELP